MTDPSRQLQTPKLITLDAWARATYGDDAPNLQTLRRWAKGGKIHPAPEKHGRAYFVAPDAHFGAANDHEQRNVRPARKSTPAEPIESATNLIDRMIHGRKAQTA